MSSVSQRGGPELQAASVRRAKQADAEALAQLGAQTFTETFGHLYPPADLAAFLAEAHSAARVAADLADPATALWLAEVAGEPVGYALAGPCGLPHPEVRPGDGELKRLYVRRGVQGEGLGARLFAAAHDWLQREGPRTVWIGVWSQNHGAQRFYQRHGFAVVGTYGFAVGQTVDEELIMRRLAVSFSKGKAEAG